MAEDKTIQDAVKALADMWNGQDKKVCAEEIRKWIQPHLPHIFELLSQKEVAGLIEKISADAFPEGYWQSAVALNQILFLAQAAEHPERAEEVLKKFHEVWDKQPLNLSALLVEWRKAATKSKLSPEIILETINYDPSKQSYFDPDISGDGTEFFMNVYKEEFDLDVDALSDRVAGVVGNGLLREFFRLVDVDRPMEPEEFVDRVGKAVDILSTAKEQGLDVRAVFKKWDELADAGGERLEKLPVAVKAVAEKAVRERFWERIKEILEENDVRVFDGELPEDALSAFYYLGMVDIKTDDVDVSGAEAYMTKIAALLKKARAIPMYSVDEIARIIKRTGVQKVTDREEAEFIASVLSQLERGAAKVFAEEDVGDVVVDLVLRAKREGVEEGQIASAVNEVLLEVFHGSVAGAEEIAHFLERKLLS